MSEATIKRPRPKWMNRDGKRLMDGRGVPSTVTVRGQTLTLSGDDMAFVLSTWRGNRQATYAAVKRRDGTVVDLPVVQAEARIAEAAAIAWNPNQVADAAVNNADLQWVIAHWGQADGLGGIVGVRHLLAVIAAWGPVTPPTAPLQDSGPIGLGSGNRSISNLRITGNTGIVGDNATHVGILSVNNCEIRTTNYGFYLGDVDEIHLSRVKVFCDANGPDSYSIRACVNRVFNSVDCEFHSGIKAFRIPECHGGTHTRFKITGDRAMLGGGYANEWASPGPFENVNFVDGSFDVNSVEIYDRTSNVKFERVDFAGTGHISIQFGAHDITFVNCPNTPTVKFFDAAGNRYTPTPLQLAARNIRGI